jgi:hypothetical protein
VAHEAREVLKLAPEVVHLVDRTIDRSHLLNPDRPIPGRSRVTRLAGAEPARADHVQGGDAENGGNRGGESRAIGTLRLHGRGEDGDVHRVAADARPHPARARRVGKNAQSVTDFARTKHLQRVSTVGRKTREPRHRVRCHQLSGAEPDTEQCEAAGELLARSVVFAILVLFHGVSRPVEIE